MICPKRLRYLAFSAMTLALAAGSAPAGARDQKSLQAELQRLTKTIDGRVGACIEPAAGPPSCLNGDQRFPLQSVMKLFVGVAVMDAVDTKNWRLDDPINVRREDLSACHQPIAARVGDSGYKTTIGDLLRRAIAESDCAAADILIARLGGPSAVQALLVRHGFKNIRIDRDERHLQTEIAGLSWRPEYADPHLLDQAMAEVPRQQRDAAYRAYQTDMRDTATPRAVGAFLQALSAGRLLSAGSTRHILNVMSETTTFSDRLKAGLEPGWSLAHKTGTSGSWDGVTAATNDVGLLTSPDGRKIAVAAFIADSRAPSDKRSAVIAAIARAAIAADRP